VHIKRGSSLLSNPDGKHMEHWSAKNLLERDQAMSRRQKKEAQVRILTKELVHANRE